MSKMRAAVLIAVVVALAAPMAFAGTAAAPNAACVASSSQARIDWNAGNGPQPAAVRVYFQSSNAKTEHFLEMRQTGKGQFFAVLPKPQGNTATINYRIATVDGTREGLTRLRGSIALSKDCPAPGLGALEASYASSLIVGSVEAASPAVPVGFKCDGIIGRIDAKGQLSAFDACGEQTLAIASLSSKRQQRAVDTVSDRQRVATNGTPVPGSTAGTVQVASASVPGRIASDVILPEELAPEELLDQIEEEEEEEAAEKDPIEVPPLEIISPSRP